MTKRQPVGNERNKLDLDKELIAAFERATARDHPNPGRVGCPSPAQLKEITEAGEKISAEILDHIGRCWPCLQGLKLVRRSRM